MTHSGHFTGLKGAAMKRSEKGRERRKHPRFNKNISVHIKHRSHKVSGKLKHQDDLDSPHSTANGKDISKGGLCFYSDVPYKPGTDLKMTIRISGMKDEAGHNPMYLMSSTIPVRADVRVTWCKPGDSGKNYEVGVEFIDIYGDDYTILQKNLTE